MFPAPSNAHKSPAGLSLGPFVLASRTVLACCAVLACFTVLACSAPETPSTEAPAAEAKPQSVILFIGDGFGFNQLAFARNFVHGPGGRFALEDLPVTGIMSTASATHETTDSGAAATALAAGVKTKNKAVGVTEAGAPAESIAEVAQEKGWKVGYVTTTRITHATPASFYAHVNHRYKDVDTIGEHLLDHAPDLILGGGKRAFLPDSEGGRRKDGRNLLEEAKAAGFHVVEDALPEAPVPPQTLGVFAMSHLAYTVDALQRPVEERPPTLEQMTRVALDTLGQDDQSFFLMVEGGRIDHGGHDFDAPSVAWETAEFDKAVAAALEYQAQHPETLIVLTADHATGGLAFSDSVDWDALKRQKASVAWMSRAIRHDGAGLDMLAEKTGYTDFTEADLAAVRAPEHEGMICFPETEDGSKDEDAARVLGAQLGKRYGITWMPCVGEDTHGHTGEDVPLYAGGPGAERFQGTLDNTDVPKILRELLGW